MASRKGEHYAFCTVCNCDISISHGRRTDVATHVASKKPASNVQCKEKQHRLQQFFGREGSDVIHAECLFTDFLLEHNIPLSASEHVGPLLHKMFPMSDVAKCYACSATFSLPQPPSPPTGQISLTPSWRAWQVCMCLSGSIHCEKTVHCKYKFSVFLVFSFFSKMFTCKQDLIHLPCFLSVCPEHEVAKVTKPFHGPFKLLTELVHQDV